MASVTTLSKKPKAPTVKRQTGTDRTLYATWTWDWTGTENVIAKWEYYTPGQGPFPGEEETCDPRGRSLYDPPSHATKVRCRLMAKGKYKNSDKEWKTNWSTATYYYMEDLPSLEPPQPTVTVDGYTLKAEIRDIDADALNCETVSFTVFYEHNNGFVKSSPKLTIKNRYVSWTTTVDPAYKYVVRAFTYNADGDKSDPSGYSSAVGVIPEAVSSITKLKAVSESSVRVEYGAATGADSYQIEYATDKSYFDSSGEVSSSSAKNTYAIITGLESGKEWFFRVRAVNESGESEWTAAKSIKIGEKPSAPTTWSSTTTAITGEQLILYWAHNSEDNSSQETAILELTIGGEKSEITIANNRPEEEKDKTSTYEIDTSAYPEGTKIKWRVKTKGIMPDYSDWSVLRVIDIYAKPSVAMSVTDVNGEGIDILAAFPIKIKATTSPKTQTPLSYHLTVVANEAYETVDTLGNTKLISKDAEVYNEFFDISTDYEHELSASNIDLENGISYTIKCLVAMNSGLTAEDTHIFTVGWGDYEGYEPEAELTFEEDTYSMVIRPYCAMYPMHYYKVEYKRGVYRLTEEEIPELEGVAVDGESTSDGYQVYEGITAENEEIFFAMVEDPEGILIEGVTMSVYRREYDGTFVEIGKGIENNGSSYITDPHPSLDYGRYRIVATDTATGAVIYSDVTGVPILCDSIIIQWDEEWRNFDSSAEAIELPSEPVWSGSLLKLRGNIDTEANNDNDVSLVEYIGREHPVSYYGTQRREASNWKAEIDRDDKETLYAIRRLAIWKGDAYVREPSGIGYWANVKVSYSQTHKEVTIPVSLAITRVAGGV